MIVATYEENGQIIGIMSGPRQSIDAAIESGVQCVVIAHEDEADNKYVLDGQLAEKGTPPSEAHTFDYDLKQWVYDLEDQKSAKWQTIKLQRSEQEFGTFDWGGYTFQCDEVSQRRIQGAVQLAAIDSTMTLDWTLADNTVQTFTAAEYVQIGQALANHVSQCHERGRILRQQIQSATTEAELEAIVW